MPLAPEINRTIIAHMDLVEPIAALYRGQKGIQFEDILAAGREGLVKAAHQNKNPHLSKFSTWAGHHIHGEIQHLIRDWKALDTRGPTLEGGELELKIYEWRLYQTPYESWKSLYATPEELVGWWQDITRTSEALTGALINLDKRERAVVAARFLQDPPQSLPSIARDHKISYARTIFIMARALKKLKKVLKAQSLNYASASI